MNHLDVAAIMLALSEADELTTGDHSLVVRFPRPTDRDRAIRAMERVFPSMRGE